MESTLIALPNEIIALIYRDLGRKELYTAQLTCKTVRNATISVLIELHVPISLKQLEEWSKGDTATPLAPFTIGVWHETHNYGNTVTFHACFVHTVHPLYTKVSGKPEVIWRKSLVRFEKTSNSAFLSCCALEDDAKKDIAKYLQALVKSGLEEGLDLVTVLTMLQEREWCMKYDRKYAQKQLKRIIDGRISKCKLLFVPDDIEASRNNIFAALVVLAPTMVRMGLFFCGNWEDLLHIDFETADEEELKDTVSVIVKAYLAVKMLLV